MKRFVLLAICALPLLVFSQNINKKYNYNDQGVLVSSYTGEDIDNYTFIKYYPGGQKASSGTYKNGQAHGVWKTWNEDGKLVGVARYKDGEKTGKWMVYNVNEHAIFQMSFHHNHMASAIKKSDNGQVLAKR